MGSAAPTGWTVEEDSSAARCVVLVQGHRPCASAPSTAFLHRGQFPWTCPQREVVRTVARLRGKGPKDLELVLLRSNLIEEVQQGPTHRLLEQVEESRQVAPVSRLQRREVFPAVARHQVHGRPVPLHEMEV